MLLPCRGFYHPPIAARARPGGFHGAVGDGHGHDRIVYLAGGRAASGPADEVVRPEVPIKLYGHHVDVLYVQGRVLVVAGQAAGDDAATPGPLGSAAEPVEVG